MCHIISYRACRVIWSHVVPRRTDSCHVVLCHVVSSSCPLHHVVYRDESYHAVSYFIANVVLCHVISTHVLLHYAPVSKMTCIDEIQSHHFSAIFVHISCPGGVSTGRERQLEVCCIFPWTSLCSNSTHFNCSPKVDLKPFINPVIRSRAPPQRVWNAVEPTKSCQVIRVVDRGRCHVIIRDDTGIGHTNRMVTVPYFCVREWIILVDKMMWWFSSVCRIRMTCR